MNCLDRLRVAVAGSLLSLGLHAQPIAIVNATVVNVSQGGADRHDLPDAVILLDHDRILAVGARGQVRIPEGSVIIDERGRFVIPGLVDGFSGMHSQAQANAALYEGVTTIAASGDDRRGTLFLAADPSPHIYAIDSAGSTDDWSLLRLNPAWHDLLTDGDHPHELTPAQTSAQLRAIAAAGSRGVWIGHNITTDNARRIIRQARSLHLATYGEFVATPYQIGIEAGVSTLLHMSRLELGLASRQLIAAAAADPEGDAGRNAYHEAESTDPHDPRVAAYGDLLAMRAVTLMPTFSLFYVELPEHRNLWQEPAATILDAQDLGQPSDRQTGELSYPTPEIRARRQGFAQRLWALDQAILSRHPTVLAASGAAWAGTMPGISLHVELELLVRAGLTPRQALAAATGNYAEYFGWKELGDVTAGRRADLVVLEADPTVDIRNADRIVDVFLSGQRLDRAALLKRPSTDPH